MPCTLRYKGTYYPEGTTTVVVKTAVRQFCPFASSAPYCCPSRPWPSSVPRQQAFIPLLLGTRLLPECPATLWPLVRRARGARSQNGSIPAATQVLCDVLQHPSSTAAQAFCLLTLRTNIGLPSPATIFGNHLPPNCHFEFSGRSFPPGPSPASRGWSKPGPPPGGLRDCGGSQEAE